MVESLLLITFSSLGAFALACGLVALVVGALGRSPLARELGRILLVVGALPWAFLFVLFDLLPAAVRLFRTPALPAPDAASATPSGAPAAASATPSGAPDTGSTTSSRTPDAASAAPTPALSADERREAAREIREVVAQFLRDSPGEAKRDLPSDVAPLLPLEVGAVEGDDAGLMIVPWHLSFDGDHAKLTYYLHGLTNKHHRHWFSLELSHEGGDWRIVPRQVRFVHAWRRER
ncbi:MAG: hypothetical protein JW751_18770 [Polyangiaceae bacterium]|nr:hypothetical protein [Polyangiaceae bacterium]